MDETKIVLVRLEVHLISGSLTPVFQHKTIESVLQRGEKLDNLVERSNALSSQTKMFYKTAKKVCLLMCIVSECQLTWVSRSKIRVV